MAKHISNNIPRFGTLRPLRFKVISFIYKYTFIKSPKKCNTLKIKMPFLVIFFDDYGKIECDWSEHDKLSHNITFMDIYLEVFILVISF